MRLKKSLALICTLVLLTSPAVYAAELDAANPVIVHAVTSELVKPLPSEPPANVTPAVSEDEALKIAVETFAIPESYGRPTVSFWQDPQSANGIWSFNWSPDTHPDLAAKFYLYITVSANDGSILSYSWSDQFGNVPKEPQYDRERARPLAQEFFEKLVSAERRASLKLFETGRETPDQLYFSWVRLVNDIPYRNNTVSIGIDSVSGKLLNFNISWDVTAEFPVKTDVVSLEQAQETYKKTIGMELMYNDFVDRVRGQQPRLVYHPLQDGLMIDAVTGKVIDWNGSEWTQYQPVELPAAPSSWVKPEKPLTKEEALALVREVLGGTTLKEPAGSSSHERYTGKFESEERVLVWNFSWNDEEKQSYVSVGVDATHGVIIEAYTGGQWYPDEHYKDLTPIDEVEARKLAIEAFVKIRPDLVGQVQLLDAPVTDKYLPIDYVQREYYFNFTRMVELKDGRRVRYPGNSVSVVIDRYSGELRNVYSNWSYRQFSEPATIMTRDEALAAAEKEMPLELVYVSVYPLQTTSEPVKPSIKLVYRANDTYGGSAMIDASTGHLLDYSGRDLTELRKGITDIDEHEAKAEIQIAVQQGWFETVDGKFNPLGTVSRAELAKVLVTAFDRAMIMYDYLKAAPELSFVPPAPSYSDVGVDHSYAPYIDAAIQLGIFKPAEPNSKFDPEGEVSREEVALCLVRAMGYTFIDGFDTTIDSGYSDHDALGTAYRNAVGMLVGLKVLAKGGEFQPQATITRADLAKMVVTATKVQAPGFPPYYR